MACQHIKPTGKRTFSPGGCILRAKGKRTHAYIGNKVKHGEHYLYTEEFLNALDENLKARLS